MLAVLDGELQLVNLDLDLLDLEYRALVAAGFDVNLSGETLSGEDDVGETVVLDLGETALLVEVEGDLAHVGLDLGEGDPDAVLGAVLDGVVRREPVE